MGSAQAGILAPVPGHARYLEFGAIPGTDAAAALRSLASRSLGTDFVVGLGSGFVAGLGRTIDGLRPFSSWSGPGCEVPATQADLWCWLRGTDRGEITHLARAIVSALNSAFRCDRIVDGFKHGRGLDLTGYEDGTENPEGDDARVAAVVAGSVAALDGSSFVAVQQWVHDLDRFAAMDAGDRDHIIGRRISDNAELDEAPVSAHVKRTAQESFDPPAFVVRRSMPWADATGEGLMFVAFAKSLDPFAAQIARMTGQEDGVVDGLFRFTRPISGSYFWCPPVSGGVLDLRAMGL